MNLDSFSRFKQTPQVIVDGHETFGVWSQFSFLTTRPADSDIGHYLVTSITAGRPDMIANALFGTPLLDWVLIAFNKVRNPLNWPRAGDMIEYPSDAVVLSQLL